MWKYRFCCFFFFSIFLLFLTHDSKSIQLIRMIHTQRAFLHTILCVICKHNSKTEGHIMMFCLSNDLLYYQRYLFPWLELNVRYDGWVMDLKMHRNHFLIWHVLHTYTCTCNLRLQVVWEHLHIESLLYYLRCLFSMLELDLRYDWQVTPPNMHCSVFR